MLKSEDELVAKAVLKKELVTQEELHECVDICKQQPNSHKLVDILVDNGYLSRFQRDDILNEIEKTVKILVKGSITECSGCGHSFNSGLVKSGKRRLRCGMCGIILSSPKTEPKPESLIIQEVFPVQDEEIVAEVTEVNAVVEIPGYEVKRSLGNNFHGKTYKATKDGTDYTVLMLSPEVLSDKDYIAEITALIDKYIAAEIPNTPTCYGIEFHKNMGYIVWEYIEGDSLRKILSKKKTISVEECIKIIARIVKILRYASEQEITHRNVCPANIVISKKNNKPILLNTGIHRKILEHGLFLVEEHEEAAFFIAPEHVGPQKNFDFRTDMYALGLVFYNLLATEPLFVGTSPYEIIKHGNSIDLDNLQNINPEINEDIVAILQKLLAPLPTNRYQSYKELLWHLQSPERVHKNIAVTEIEEEIFEQPTEMISKAKKLEAIEVASQRQKKKSEKKDLEGRLRKKRLEARRQKSSSGLQNAIIVLLILGAIGYFVYDYVQKNQRTQVAENAYKVLKAEYNNSKFKAPQWPSLQEQMMKYISKYKDQSFYVDNVYSHLNELRDNWKQYLYKELDRLRDEVSTLQKQKYFAACLQEINRIPDALVNEAEKEIASDIQKKLDNLRKEVIEMAKKDYARIGKKRDALLKKYRNAISKDYNPSMIDSEYSKAYKRLTKAKNAYAKNADKPQQQIGDIVSQITNDIENLQKKHKEYKDFLKQKSDDLLETQVANINENIIVERRKYNFEKAINLCNNTSDISIVEVSIIKKMRKILSYLDKGKTILINEYKNQTNIQVPYKGQLYKLEKLSPQYIVLDRGKNLEWDKTPSFLLPKLIKKVSRRSISDEDLFALSLLAKEAKDYLLFYSLLEASSRNGNSEAISYREQEDIRLEEKANQNINKLQKIVDSQNYNELKAFKQLLDIKNNYLISKNLRQEHNKKMNDLFAQIQKKKANIDRAEVFDFDDPSQINNWTHPQTKVVNGLLLAKSQVIIPNKNTQAVCGLILFKDIESEVSISFGRYLLKIDARTKAKCSVRGGGGRALNLAIPVNKWLLFSMYIRGGKMYWQVNNVAYSYNHSNEPSNNIQINAISNEVVEIESLLIAQE